MTLQKTWFWIILLALVAPSLTVLYTHSQHPMVLRNARRSPTAICYLVQFGVTDQEPTTWDGRIAVSGGSVSRIEGWRFAADDSTDNHSAWKLSTRHNIAAAGGQMMENGIIVDILDGSYVAPRATVTIDTGQGKFSFSARDIEFGAAKLF